MTASCSEIFGWEDAYRLDDVLPLMKGGTVVEVGAHKGYFTILAAAHAERVLVFEPDVKNHGYILRNVELNQQRNVTAVQAAVADASEVRQFTVSSKTAARHTFYGSKFSGAGETVDVRCVTLTQIRS